MKRILLCLSFAITGCVAEIRLPEAENQTEAEAVEVVLDVTGVGASKSSLSVNEFSVGELQFVIYRSGVLEYSEYVPSLVPSLKVRLMAGCVYNIYVLANAGKLPVSVSEDEFKEKCIYSINEISELQGRLPMAWSRTGVQVREGMGSIVVQLERLAAKVNFSLDKNVFEGLRITSARLCQCASVVRPFRDSGGRGSYAMGPDELIDGDMATEEDLLELNSGKSIGFYALENCQGILLPDNVSPACKVPEELGPVADLCTYLEVAGVFEEDAFLDGEVVYRFYLGLDACTSFDVPGNSSIDVTLQLTGTGLREVSWRVSADVSVREGYAWGSVAHGLHDVDDLYVGERFLYEVELSDEILSYIGGDASVCSLWLDSESEALEFSDLVGEGNVYTCEVTCHAPATGSLYLLGPAGERLATLSKDVGIRQPKLVFSEYEYGDSQLEGLSYIPECVINGNQETVYLYLVDNNRRNLNSSDAYGFDLEAFDFSVQGIGPSAAIEEFITSSFLVGEECSGGFAYELRFSCLNDGEDYAAACVLAEAYSSGRVLDVLVGDSLNGLSGHYPIRVAIWPITLTLVDNRWAGYHSAHLSVIVDNKSEMPLEIAVCQMVDSNKDWSSSEMTTSLRRYVEQNLVRESMSYLTGSVCSHDQSVYVSSSEVQCAGGGVFPLTGIEAEDIMKSMVYDKLGHDRMYHLVEVTMGGYGIYASDLSLVNSLSDGSSLYDTIYLSDWQSKGLWLFSNGDLIDSPGNYLMHLPNLTPLNIKGLRQKCAAYSDVVLTLWYDEGVFRGCCSNAQAVASGLRLTVRWHGTVEGYVQTDPQGVWGSVKDNYCSASFDRTIKGLPLASFQDDVSFDDGTIRAAMDAIYAQTFEDKANGSKFQHSAHPVSMACNVDVFVEGENGEELYPVQVTWELPYVTYYHAQDGVTYTCQMTQNTPCFKMVHVAKKSTEL